METSIDLDREDGLRLRDGTLRWVHVDIKIDKYFLAVVICTMFASIGSELAQTIITRGRRMFDPLDILCNMVGSIIGILVAYVRD